MLPHLQAVELATGKPPPELSRYEELQEELWPENLAAWLAFGRLAGARSTGFGLGPILLSEIAAYFQLKGEPPDWWLIQKVQVIDRAFLEAQSKKQGKKTSEQNGNHRATRSQGRPHRR